MSRRTRQLARGAEGRPLTELSEDEWQAWVVEKATAAGWVLQFHVLRAQVKGRWVTNTSSKGVPDLWLLRPDTGELLVLELKAEDAPAVAPVEQRRWIAGLQRVPGVQAYIARPSDAAELLHVLARPRA